MKMRHIGTALLAMALTACLGLTACVQDPKTYAGADVALTTASVGVTLISLDKGYDSIVSVISKPSYTDADKTSLSEAKASVDRVRADLKAAASGNTATAFVYLTSEKASTSYAELKNAYVLVRGVILAHRDEFTSADWNYLVALNSTLISLDADVQKLYAAKGNVDAQWAAALTNAAQAAANIAQLMAESRH